MTSARRARQASDPVDATVDAAANLRLFRRWLLGLFAIGVLGMAAELLLTAHTEGAWQLVPLVLLATSAVVLIWHVALRSKASVRGHQAVMLLFIASGVVGTFLHYRANIEFELEMYPGLSGVALAWKAIQGASPPSLAPGAMIALGLLGLIYAHRHPALGATSTDRIGAKP